MRKLFITLSVLIGCLLVYLGFISGKRYDHLTYSGKSLRYWEDQALLQVPQGNEQAILPAVEKMGPEAVSFWLERLQARDSISRRTYMTFWTVLPNRIKVALPAPVAQRTRRNMAYFILSKLQFTNGIPELIELSYSKDPELRFYAINLLWLRAYHCYEPSSECIAAFASALQTGDARTRISAVDGLNIIPLRHEALPALHLALNDTEEEVRVKAASAIIKLQPTSDLTHIFEAGIMSSNSNVRVISSVALSELKRRQRTRPQESVTKPL